MGQTEQTPKGTERSPQEYVQPLFSTDRARPIRVERPCTPTISSHPPKFGFLL
jgi:hypothetical protein